MVRQGVARSPPLLFCSFSNSSWIEVALRWLLRALEERSDVDAIYLEPVGEQAASRRSETYAACIWTRATGRRREILWERVAKHGNMAATHLEGGCRFAPTRSDDLKLRGYRYRSPRKSRDNIVMILLKSCRVENDRFVLNLQKSVSLWMIYRVVTCYRVKDYWQYRYRYVILL